MIKFREKLYSQYDETDALKRIKDSDILAEKKKSNKEAYKKILMDTATGAGIGAISGVAKNLYDVAKHGKPLNLGGSLKSGGKIGALVGGAVGFLRNRNTLKENGFYNDRLETAQRYAKRRERRDWIDHTKGRGDGPYTY